MKKIHPQIPLGIICRKGLGSVLQSLRVVDFYWEIQKGNPQSYQEIQRLLKNFEIENLVSAHTSIRTTLFCAKIKAQKKITFAKPWNFFIFSERVKWQKQFPEALRLLSLIKNQSEELKKQWDLLPDPATFIQKNEKKQLPPPPPWADPNLCWSLQDAKYLFEKWNVQNTNFIALFPGSVWATKMWKKDGYIQLGNDFHKMNYQILVMGGPEEKILGQEVADGIPHAINLCGKTSLFESLILLSKAKLVVGNDSSSSHMAALVGVPIVSIFGPTVLKFGYRPWAKKTYIAEFDDLPCRPCSPHGPMKCPLGHHDCMKKIDAANIFRIAEVALKN